jgi:hypothetical protein
MTSGLGRLVWLGWAGFTTHDDGNLPRSFLDSMSSSCSSTFFASVLGCGMCGKGGPSSTVARVEAAPNSCCGVGSDATGFSNRNCRAAGAADLVWPASADPESLDGPRTLYEVNAFMEVVSFESDCWREGSPIRLSLARRGTAAELLAARRGSLESIL